jgi:hypothetical protein
MKTLFILTVIGFFIQSAMAGTDQLSSSSHRGIPSMNKIIESNKAESRKEQEKAARQATAKEKQTALTDLENEIIRNIYLQHPVIASEKNSGYLCLRAMTAGTSQIIGGNKEESKKLYTKLWGEKLHPKKLDLSKFAEKFFARNEYQGQITCTSSPKDGFLLDMGECGKGDSNCRGSSSVSIPVYDEKTGLVLAYRAIFHGPLAASGWIFLYHYDRTTGRVTLVRKLDIWIS